MPGRVDNANQQNVLPKALATASLPLSWGKR